MILRPTQQFSPIGRGLVSVECRPIWNIFAIFLFARRHRVSHSRSQLKHIPGAGRISAGPPSICQRSNLFPARLPLLAAMTDARPAIHVNWADFLNPDPEQSKSRSSRCTKLIGKAMVPVQHSDHWGNYRDDWHCCRSVAIPPIMPVNPIDTLMAAVACRARPHLNQFICREKSCEQTKSDPS